MVGANPYAATSTSDPVLDPIDGPAAPTRRAHNLEGFDTVRYAGREWLRGWDEAGRWIGRKRTTIYEWQRAGNLRAVKVSAPHPVTGRPARVWAISPGSLVAAAREADRRRAAQRHLPGPGRGRKGRRSAHELEALQERAARREAEAAAERARVVAERRRRQAKAEALEDELHRRRNE
ncbi:hypothetical protein ACPXB3_00345 [Gordonia sp. DT219]|uniref:hypothetical protein n=1 Tax=Gordonia sp. DT219 TaxID=3416658 RepID=UPI003CF4F77D